MDTPFLNIGNKGESEQYGTSESLAKGEVTSLQELLRANADHRVDPKIIPALRFLGQKKLAKAFVNDCLFDAITTLRTGLAQILEATSSSESDYAEVDGWYDGFRHYGRTTNLRACGLGLHFDSLHASMELDAFETVRNDERYGMRHALQEFSYTKNRAEYEALLSEIPFQLALDPNDSHAFDQESRLKLRGLDMQGTFLWPHGKFVEEFRTRFKRCLEICDACPNFQLGAKKEANAMLLAVQL